MPIISSISSIQVAEALKLLVGDSYSLHSSLIQIDVWQNEWRKIKLAAPNPDCRTCSQHDFEFLDAESQEFAAVLCGRDAVQISPARPTQIDLAAFAENISTVNNRKRNDYLVRFTVGGHEISLFGDGRAIIKGTDDVSIARSLYARFVGS